MKMSKDSTVSLEAVSKYYRTMYLQTSIASKSGMDG